MKTTISRHVDERSAYDVSKIHAADEGHSIGEDAFVASFTRLLDISIEQGYFSMQQATTILSRLAWYAKVIGRRVTRITPEDSLGGDAFQCPVCQSAQIRAGYKFCPHCRAALTFTTVRESNTMQTIQGDTPCTGTR